MNIELEMRAAWTVSDWGRFARRHYGPDATVVARACPEPEPVTEEGAAQDLREDVEERSAIQRETSDPGALWGRVAILDPGGRTVEVDTPSGSTVADWQAYAARYHGPGCSVTAVLPLPKRRRVLVNIEEAPAAACEGVAGIIPEVFRCLLGPEDVADIEAGDIHPKTLKAYAQSFAEGIRSGRLVPAARAKS